MNNRPLRIGIIGCGAQGEIHLKAIRELSPGKATVNALCDLNEERLKKAKESWPEAYICTDYREIFTSGDLNLVIVATMPNTHVEIAVFALEAGSHVLCEKPFALDLGEVERILEVADRVGKQIQVGLNMRYMPSPIYLRQLVASGEVGRPVSCKVWGIHPNPPWWGPHYRKKVSGGGVLASTLIHSLDLSIWVAGSPRPLTVAATMARLFPGKRGSTAPEGILSDYDVEDLLTAFVRFDDGSTFFLEGNWCSEGDDVMAFELVTTKATLVNNPFAVIVDEAGSVVDRTPQLGGKDDWFSSIRDQDADLIERLLAGRDWDIQDRREILNLHKIIDACYESARIGREIEL